MSIYKAILYSEWQCVHEDFIHNGWRWDQVFQFKIEDSLEALGAQCSELRKFAQESGQVVGPGGLRGTCGDVVSETRDQAVLEVFDPFGFFQAVSICWSQVKVRDLFGIKHYISVGCVEQSNLPVIMTSVARQEKDDTSKFKRCKL